MTSEKLNSLPLQNIRIHDSFWDKYIGLVKNVIIPYQWEILNDRVEGVELSHCLENFRIAAGRSEGTFHGAVFQDTDVAKWLEAVAYVLASAGRDEALEQIADDTIDLIGEAQCEDGYLNTYFTIKEPALRWTNLKDGHELYTAGHMIEAAVAYYQATGKKKFVEIVSRFADLIAETFGPEEGKIHGYPGHQEIELALVKLYQVTGRESYRNLAKYFIETRGTGENYFLEEEKGPLYKRIFPEFVNYDPRYSQSHLPVRQQQTAEGHAVRAVYMYCAMADLAYEYQDETLLAACDRLWENTVNKRMYITGSIGSSGLLERFTTDYDLPNDCNYSETCASIGLALFAKRMAEIKKDASYMDVAERALYNTVLDGIAMDGKSFFYVNPLEVWPDNCMDRTSKEHVKPVRQKWFGVACCPPNIARTLASLGQYVYFQDKDTVYMNLYLSNRTRVEFSEAASVDFETMKDSGQQIAGNSVDLEVTTNFPYDGRIKITAESTKENWKLALRLPDYVENYDLTVGGVRISSPALESHYIMVNGNAGKTEILLDFSIPARFVRANPKVRADLGKAAVVKGPLVYCLEEMDNGENLSAYYVDTAAGLKEEYREDLFGGCQVIRLKGKKASEDSWQDGALYGSRPLQLEDAELTAIPYCFWGNRTPGEMTVWLKELI